MKVRYRLPLAILAVFIAVPLITYIAIKVYFAFIQDPDRNEYVPPPDGPPTPEIAAPAPRAPQPTMAETIADIDFETARWFPVARSNRVDGGMRQGAAQLAIWASERLAWEDVKLKKDETSLRKIEKDEVSSIGKRLCVRGEITQIVRDRTVAKPMFNGMLMTRNANMVRFMAAGDTGDLVEDSRARFCGISAGTMTYETAFGGQAMATVMVGMFDLPSNREAAGDVKKATHP